MGRFPDHALIGERTVGNAGRRPMHTWRSDHLRSPPYGAQG